MDDKQQRFYPSSENANNIAALAVSPKKALHHYIDSLPSLRELIKELKKLEISGYTISKVNEKRKS